MDRIKDMNILEEEIRDENGELKMYRLVIEDITVEDLIDFLKCLD